MGIYAKWNRYPIADSLPSQPRSTEEEQTQRSGPRVQSGQSSTANTTEESPQSVGFGNGRPSVNQPSMNHPLDQRPTPQDASFAATGTKRQATDDIRFACHDEPKKLKIPNAYEAGRKSQSSIGSTNQTQENAEYAAVGDADAEMGMSPFSFPTPGY
jgi:hypothetical protein